MNVYEECPVFENEDFLLRLAQETDCDDLLKVYSDEKAVPLFNSDNCHGDDFHYRTRERMAQAIAFWMFSYKERYFVRWSIIDRKTGETVGTIELFRRESDGSLPLTALLRLDLRSDYEQPQPLSSLLSLIAEPACKWFGCSSVTTKAAPCAAVRRQVLEALGFKESSAPVIGGDGTRYGHYFVWSQNA